MDTPISRLAAAFARWRAPVEPSTIVKCHGCGKKLRADQASPSGRSFFCTETCATEWAEALNW